MNRSTKFMARLCGVALLAAAIDAAASAAPDARTPPDNSCLEHLDAACGKGVNEVRQLIARSGVSISIDVFNYGDEPSVTDRHRFRPAQLKDLRPICHVFDGKGSTRYSERCRAGDGKGAIECEIEYPPSERFTLEFRIERGAARLASIRGTVEN